MKRNQVKTSRTSRSGNDLVAAIIATLGLFLSFAAKARANETGASEMSQGLVYKLENLTRETLTKRYSGAQIEIKSEMSLSIDAASLQNMAKLESLQITREDESGLIEFLVRDRAGRSFSGSVTVSVTVPAYIAKRRIFPGESLDRGQFEIESINLLTQKNRDIRGYIVSSAENETTGADFFERKLLRQTILEGSPLLMTQIERAPDKKKGDLVRIRIQSGVVTLSTAGVLLESAMEGKPVRVMNQKTKKDFAGILSDDGSVVVTL